MNDSLSHSSANMLDLLAGTAPVVLEPAARAEIAAEVAGLVRREFPPEALRAPTDAGREAVRGRIGQQVAQALRRRGLSAVRREDEQNLADEIARRMLGLGFLDLLLPPARRDLSEIALDPFGVVWVRPKGRRAFEPVPDLNPDPVEVDTVFSTLFGQQLRAYSEANPSVNGTLPRTRHNPGGGRIKYLHPVIAQGAGFPSVNIRLFEPAPVRPETLLAWGMLDGATLDLLARLVRAGRRGLIVGGTATGKTTVLSMLCNFLPVGFRIVTIEDPQEIWIDHPHVVTLQARPAAPGSELRPYTLRDGVDDAMRMTPDYLVVGEVRDGHAGQALLRAMMSDHPGMSTFHAESASLAVERLALLLDADAGMGERAARRLFAAAVDWVLRIGFDRDGQRRVLGLDEVAGRGEDGEVGFRPLVVYAGDGRWERLAAPERVGDLPMTWQEVIALDREARARLRGVLEARRRAFAPSADAIGG